MHVHAVYVRPNEQMQLGAERRLSAQPRVGDRYSNDFIHTMIRISIGLG